MPCYIPHRKIFQTSVLKPKVNANVLEGIIRTHTLTRNFKSRSSRLAKKVHLQIAMKAFDTFHSLIHSYINPYGHEINFFFLKPNDFLSTEKILQSVTNCLVVLYFFLHVVITKQYTIN